MRDPSKHRRLRFVFSLRTLFLVVTAFAVWIGYELNWIHRRHELINRHAHLLFAVQGVEESLLDERSIAWAVESVSGDRVAPVAPMPAPGLLGLFSERGLNDLTIIVQIDKANKLIPSSLKEIELAKRLFPEANLSLYYHPLDLPDGTTGMQEYDMPKRP
jgi:hypothetical protein